ncbi:hypothetical protein [Paraburkholderia sp. BR14374]|uniref:hypothetical protein n=1 Tax=Paraburkholderia sp. BR14374 TaxID=3237007 RepID=UPI0034CEF8ED
MFALSTLRRDALYRRVSERIDDAIGTQHAEEITEIQLDLVRVDRCFVSSSGTD